MSTLNGIGTKFHGFRNCEPDGTCDVTCWFVFLYFPVIPLSSYRIKREQTDMRVFHYQTTSKLKMDYRSILTTYLWGWMITPVLMFWPLFFAVREVGEFIGYTNAHAEGTFYHVVIGFAILYVIIFA